MSLGRTLRGGSLLFSALGAMVVSSAPLLASDRAEEGAAPDREAETPSSIERASREREALPQKFQIGFGGTFDWDEGERTILVGVGLDWMSRDKTLVHSSASIEERVSAFYKTDAAIGLGTLFEGDRFSVPVWMGAGITVTGLWDHSLSRSCFRLGSGYRYHSGERVAFAINEDLFVYGQDNVRAVTTVGLAYVIRRG